MVANTPQTLELNITGMDCASCALNLERGVSRLDGVATCEINFTTGKMRIAGEVSQSAVEARVRALGYDVAAPSADEKPAPTSDPQGLPGLIRYLVSRRDTSLALFGVVILLIGALLSLLPVPAGVVLTLHLLVVALAGLPILRNGWRELIYSRNVTINLLMSIATVGALIIGETGEAATVIVLFAIGEALEGYSAERARYSLRSLLSMVPQEAILLTPCLDCQEHLGQDGYTGGPCPFCEFHEKRVPVETLQVGDVILVPPGQSIPMDGQVVSGETTVNQAPITGESLPVPKSVDDDVFAGSINGTSTLTVRVTHLAADNTLSRIIQLVQEAQAQRAPTQRLIDRFARWYTPAVVLLALLVALVPPVLLGEPFWSTPDGAQGWLYRALALLIVACPCALVISTPVSIVSALTTAARRGILIKGGAPLEALASIRAFAFDKTGTLTEGMPALTGVYAFDQAGQTQNNTDAQHDLLALAAAVERRSEHPLAHAVVTAAEARGVMSRYPAAENVASITGRGVRGTVNGQTITIGNHPLLHSDDAQYRELCQTVSDLETKGQTVMLVHDGQRTRGILTVADQLRASSQAAVTALREMQPSTTIIMLTGDNAAVAQAIGEHVGVDEVCADLLPEHKLNAVQDLENRHGPVAMVGDGINDAPALAAARVGIAMGGTGTAQAMETADVVLMQGDLSHLPEAVSLSQRTHRVIMQNVVLSLGLKVAFLLLVPFGLATLWLAVFADMGASLLVTANGMRLLNQRKTHAH